MLKKLITISITAIVSLQAATTYDKSLTDGNDALNYWSDTTDSNLNNHTLVGATEVFTIGSRKNIPNVPTSSIKVSTNKLCSNDRKNLVSCSKSDSLEPRYTDEGLATSGENNLRTWYKASTPKSVNGVVDEPCSALDNTGSVVNWWADFANLRCARTIATYTPKVNSTIYTNKVNSDLFSNKLPSTTTTGGVNIYADKVNQTIYADKYNYDYFYSFAGTPLQNQNITLSSLFTLSHVVNSGSGDLTIESSGSSGIIYQNGTPIFGFDFQTNGPISAYFPDLSGRIHFISADVSAYRSGGFRTKKQIIIHNLYVAKPIYYTYGAPIQNQNITLSTIGTMTHIFSSPTTSLTLTNVGINGSFNYNGTSVLNFDFSTDAPMSGMFYVNGVPNYVYGDVDTHKSGFKTSKRIVLHNLYNVAMQCPAGYNDNGANCAKTIQVCPDASWNDNGFNCTKVTPIVSVTNYNCPADYLDMGTYCKKTVQGCPDPSWTSATATTCSKVVQICPDASWTDNGTNCKKNVPEYKLFSTF